MNKRLLMNRIRQLYICLTLLFSYTNVSSAVITLQASGSPSKLFFRFGEAVVENGFRDNDQTLFRIDSIFSSVKELSKIKIVGSASPEGEKKFNEHLCKKRADALQKYISEKFNIPDTLFLLEYAERNLVSSESWQDMRYAAVTIFEKEVQSMSAKPHQDINEKAGNEISENPINSVRRIFIGGIGIMLLIVCCYFLLSKLPFSFSGRKCFVSRVKPDYPPFLDKASVESCNVDDSDIPEGRGGINSERYTYGQLRYKPVISEVLRRLENRKMKEWADECNARNKDGFKMVKISGQYCFWSLRVGPVVKAPSVREMRRILSCDSETAEALRKHKVTTGMVRKINYKLYRKSFAKKCGISEDEAALAIGNKMECAIHEDISGYIFMVPNWAHNWFDHTGYASKMVQQLNEDVL